MQIFNSSYNKQIIASYDEITNVAEDTYKIYKITAFAIPIILSIDIQERSSSS